MTNKKTFQVAEGVSHVCNFFRNLQRVQWQTRWRKSSVSERWALISTFWQNCVAKLLRECYTQATCLATLRKVEGHSTFLATRNATIAVAKWGVIREFFLATCNATFVALQVAKNLLRVTWPLVGAGKNLNEREKKSVEEKSRRRVTFLRPNFFLAHLDFSPPPLTAAGSPRMKVF